MKAALIFTVVTLACGAGCSLFQSDEPDIETLEKLAAKAAEEDAPTQEEPTPLRGEELKRSLEMAKAQMKAGKIPLPLLPGSIIDDSQNLKFGRKGRLYHVNLRTDKRPADVTAYYNEELSALGLRTRTKRSNKLGDGDVRTLVGRKKRVRVRVSAQRESKKGTTKVLLSWRET